MSSPGKVAHSSIESPSTPYVDGREGDLPIEIAVRDAIRTLLPDDPTIRAVALALSMNVRTLQRRLAARRLSYRRVLDECRHRWAEAELTSRERTVADISRQLGYSDPAHFVRAFRRWTGDSPTGFSARQRQ